MPMCGRAMSVQKGFSSTRCCLQLHSWTKAGSCGSTSRQRLNLQALELNLTGFFFPAPFVGLFCRYQKLPKARLPPPTASLCLQPPELIYSPKLTRNRIGTNKPFIFCLRWFKSKLASQKKIYSHIYI